MAESNTVRVRNPCQVERYTPRSSRATLISMPGTQPPTRGARPQQITAVTVARSGTRNSSSDDGLPGVSILCHDFRARRRCTPLTAPPGAGI